MSRQKKIVHTSGEKRRLRRQQIIFASIAIFMILAMVISLFRF